MVEVKKYKTVLLLAAAVVFSAVAAYTAHIYLQKKEQALLARFENKQNQVSIIVPNKKLEVGDTISMDTVSAREIPADYLPSGTFDPNEFGAIEGMVVKEPVPEGSPLLRHQVDGLAGVSRFSELLKNGERAVTISVDNLNSNENMILPGDLVDVLVKMEGDDNGSEVGAPALSSVLDRRRVLAIDFTTVADPSIYQMDTAMKGYRSMTLSVEARDVAKLIAARESGELVLLLRNAEEPGRSRYGALSQFHPGSLGDGGGVRVYSAAMAEGATVTPRLVPISTRQHNRWTREGSGRLYQKLDETEQTPPSLHDPIAQTNQE